MKETQSPFEFNIVDNDQATQKSITCLGMTFANDEARRTHFIEKLREKLQDPAFRQIEGFPLGSDEDILNLSDPPYYTACPNPWLADFIAEWEAQKPALSGVEGYHREPFAADVSEGKNDPIYDAHSYHTKVPPKAIMQYILHYTEPGDIVLDGFCGTGMTGIAARECAHPNASEIGIKSGARQAILIDLSSLPTFIAGNLNASVIADEVEQEFSRLLKLANDQFGSYFTTTGSDGIEGTVQYCIWSDIFICSNCTQEFSYWDGAVSLIDGVQCDPFPCPHCGASLKKRTLTRAFTIVNDPQVNETYKRPKRQIVYLNYMAKGMRFSKYPSSEDIKKATELANILTEKWAPSDVLPKLDRFFKDGLHLVSLTNYHRFYFPRTLHILAFLWSQIETDSVPGRLRNPLRLILTSMLDRNLTIRNRFVINKYNPRGRINGPLANTLYVPGLSVEQNPLEALAYKSKEVIAAFRDEQRSTIVSTQDLSSVEIPENSIDYIFIDPPFGHNIMYSELNGITESWLRVKTNIGKEAVVSEAQQKTVMEYTSLMKACFKKCYQSLKSDRWMTVEFHNSQNTIWNAIQEAINQAGFVIADVRTLDKKKGTINQEYYTSGSVKQDLVISAYKPNGGLEKRFQLEAGTEDGVWDFIRTHLGNLPVFVNKDGKSEVIAERKEYLLYDRMVGFHVQRNVTVPLAAAEFYAGLSKRFPERDGMYFLPSQAAEYDKKRMTVDDVSQFSLFVSDEASARQWLRELLHRKPQTFQDLHPQFLKESSVWSKAETPMELSLLLEQNFIHYDGKGPVPEQIHAYLSTNWKDMRNLEKNDPQLVAKAHDRWYVPDPNKAVDLEKLRERALLREFEEYKQTRKKLKVFRLEAVRAGFKKAWQERDYPTIVSVADKIPTNVLEEDPKLLMWYDQAVTRLGSA